MTGTSRNHSKGVVEAVGVSQRAAGTGVYRSLTGARKRIWGSATGGDGKSVQVCSDPEIGETLAEAVLALVEKHGQRA